MSCLYLLTHVCHITCIFTTKYLQQCETGPIQQKPLDWSDAQESQAREMENRTFTPLIFGTNGAMDYECENVQLRDLTNTLLQWIGYGHV